MAKNAAGSKTDYLETIHLAHAGIVSGTAESNPSGKASETALVFHCTGIFSGNTTTKESEYSTIFFSTAKQLKFAWHYGVFGCFSVYWNYEKQGGKSDGQNRHEQSAS